MAAQPVVISAPHFVLQINGQTVAVFTQLKGISANVEPNEYIYTNHKGQTIYTKQFGKTKPSEVMLEDPGLNKTLWKLHQAARQGSPAAKKNMTLLVENASHQVLFSYTLLEAWVSKIELSGMKAGATENVMETVTIVCEEIIVNQPNV